ncbi:5-hydroxytryptamine receptor 1D-like [Ptychodera flava]|uniref:5-hydroxytryptamine receptor 1D-like n=1 Tax=Ptychodera flava TaxID=63121 RepID=UPI00396A4601
MTVICIDRYLAILQPMRYRPVRTQRVIISMIAAAWVCGFMAEVPATLLWEAVTGYSIIDYNDTCDVEWVDNVPYTLTSTFMTIIFPFIIMLVLYAQIYYIIRKRAKELGNFRHRVRTSPVNDFDSQTESTDLQTTVFLSRRGGHHTTTLIANSTPSQRAVRYNRVTRDKKAATTLGILLGFFFLSWIPWQIVSIVNASCGSYCTPVIIYDIALWMQYSNSMVNPFLHDADNDIIDNNNVQSAISSTTTTISDIVNNNQRYRQQQQQQSAISSTTINGIVNNNNNNNQRYLQQQSTVPSTTTTISDTVNNI